MDIFGLRNELIRDYRGYVESFLNIKDPRIQAEVKKALDEGTFWPDPLVQLNPAFEPGKPLESLVREGLLHPKVLEIFRLKDRPG